MNNSIITKYNDNGEVKITNLINKKEILSILKEYKKFTNKKNGKFGKHYNYLNNSKKLTSLHRLEKYKSSYFFKIANKKIIFSTAKKLLGKDCKLHSIQFFFKNMKHNLPTPPHQDNAYWCFKNGKGLSFWIALNNTSKLNGSLYYYRGTHKKDIKHISSYGTPGSSQKIKINKKKKTHYKLDAGDSVVHDSRIIHGSFKNQQKKDRRAFIISFVTKKSKKDPIKIKNYENRLAEISKKNKDKLLN